jgi:hypothetical protein
VIAYLKVIKEEFNKEEIHLYTHIYDHIYNLRWLLRNFWKEADNERIRRMSDYFFKEFNKFTDLCEKSTISNCNLIEHYCIKNENSRFYDFFNIYIPVFSFPFAKRLEHTHILAGTGHGKTQLLLSLIYNDLLKAQEGKGGLCIIDSQGDLIDVITHLSFFDPSIENSLADKLILVDPNDVEYPVSLNVFDINLERINRLPPAQREMAINFAVSLFQYIFSDLVEGKLTMYQENIFQFCSRLLFSVPDATIMNFIELLEDSDKYRQYLSEVDETTRQFFENQFYSNLYDSTKKQLSARLWSIIRNNTFNKMFINKKNKIDMYEAMNSGKIVMINTSKMLLQSEGAKMLGKFFIALILQNTFQRASIDEDKRKSFFVYIDEAQDYMTDTMAEFLSQARKYKVGIILAHQYLKQLDSESTNLKYSTLANTSIKFVGKVDAYDARAMSERIAVEPEDILSLKKRDGDYSDFFCYIKDTTQGAVKVRLPLGRVNQKERMLDEAYNSLLQKNREKYCSALTETFERKVEVEAVVEVKDEGFKLGERKKL